MVLVSSFPGKYRVWGGLSFGLIFARTMVRVTSYEDTKTGVGVDEWAVNFAGSGTNRLARHWCTQTRGAVPAPSHFFWDPEFCSCSNSLKVSCVIVAMPADSHCEKQKFEVVFEILFDLAGAKLSTSAVKRRWKTFRQRNRAWHFSGTLRSVSRAFLRGGQTCNNQRAKLSGLFLLVL